MGDCGEITLRLARAVVVLEAGNEVDFGAVGSSLSVAISLIAVVVMFRVLALSRSLSTRAIAARRALQRDQDQRAVDYFQTKRFVDGLAKATSLGQLQATLSGYNQAAILPKHISLVAYKIGQLHQEGSNVEDDSFKSTAMNLVEKNLDAFSVPSIASLLMSLKNWRWTYPKDWPERLSKRLFDQPLLAYKSLSRAVPVLADLGIANPDIWKNVVVLIERQLPFLDQLSIAQCLYGVSRAKQGDSKFYKQIVKFLEPRVFSLDPSILSRIALSLSKAADRTPDLTCLFDKMSQQILRQLPIYKERDLKMVVSAFKVVTPGNTELFVAITNQNRATS